MASLGVTRIVKGGSVRFKREREGERWRKLVVGMELMSSRTILGRFKLRAEVGRKSNFADQSECRYFSFHRALCFAGFKRHRELVTGNLGHDRRCMSSNTIARR